MGGGARWPSRTHARGHTHTPAARLAGSKHTRAHTHTPAARLGGSKAHEAGRREAAWSGRALLHVPPGRDVNGHDREVGALQLVQYGSEGLSRLAFERESEDGVDAGVELLDVWQGVHHHDAQVLELTHEVGEQLALRLLGVDHDRGVPEVVQVTRSHQAVPAVVPRPAHHHNPWVLRHWEGVQEA